MKKAILVLILLLTWVSVYAQKESSISGASTEVVLSLDKGESLNMTFTRTSSGTDTLQVYAIFSNPYREVLLGGVKPSDRKVYTTLIVTATSVSFNFPTVGASRVIVKMLDSDSSGVLITYSTGLGPLGSFVDPTELLSQLNTWTEPQRFSEAYFDSTIAGTTNLRGQDAFNSTDLTDDVVVANASVNDIYFITLTGTVAGVDETPYVEATATGFTVRRNAGTTDGLSYNWLRIK